MSIEEPKKKRRSPQRIARELPPVGSILVGHFRNKEYRATVITAPTYVGGKAIQVGDTIYSSLSSAAKAIKGWPTNGWLFWKLKH